MPLKSFLTRLIWLSVLPLVILAAYLAFDHVRTLRLQRNLEAENMARNFATILDRNLESRMAALQVLASSSAMGDPLRLGELYLEAQAFRQTFGGHILLADASMHMIFNTRVPLGTRLPDLPRVEGHSSAAIAAATGKPAIGDLFPGPVSKTPLVSIAVPVARSRLLLVTVIEAGQFQKPLAEMSITPGWSVTLVDGKNEVIARRSLPAEGKLPGDSRGRFAVKSLVSPWSVVLEIPLGMYGAPVRSAGFALAAAILAATMASVLGGLYASRHLARSLAALTVTPFPAGSQLKIAEIATVGRMLAEAAAARAAAEATLRESEQSYRSLVENAPIAIFINRSDRIEYLNAAALRLFGADDDGSIVGRSPYELVHPSFHAAMGERIATLRNGGSVPLVETTILREDGSERIVEVVAANFADKKGTAVQVMMMDITVRKRAERELTEKNAEMERFAYMISHDLKSPLVTVKTFLGYLREDLAAADQERIEKDLHYMNSAADKMGRRLHELLEMSRVGRMVNSPERVGFRELVDEALLTVAGSIAERGVEVLVSGEAVVLNGDRSRLAEIWQNLVENAVKFMGTQASPRIEIGATREGKETVFQVRDNGVGVDPRYAEKIFGLFEKLDPAMEGTGLGLALVKRIVELYGGRIWLEPQPAGSGSVFRFVLPAALEDDGKGAPA